MKLGILTMNDEEISPFIEEIAKMSHSYNMSILVFSPLSIDFTTDIVTGRTYLHKEKKWVRITTSVPTYLYDRLFYGDDHRSEKCKHIVKSLKNRHDLQFLGYGLPNKWVQYERLKESVELFPFLLPTKLARSVDHIFLELEHRSPIILKPADGSSGHSVYELTKQKDTIQIKTEKNKEVLIKQGSIPSIKLFLESLLSYRTFIMQRKIDNVTPLNEPFDIRLFLQKDSNGKWQQLARGIRVASKGALLTNLSSTGTLVKYADFQLEHPQIDWRDIDDILDKFIHFLPNTLENYFAPLFELGVDVLIGTDGSVWICDINSKPGVKLAHFIQDKCQLSKAPLLYTLYLHQMLIQDIYRI